MPLPCRLPEGGYRPRPYMTKIAQRLQVGGRRRPKQAFECIHLHEDSRRSALHLANRSEMASFDGTDTNMWT